MDVREAIKRIENHMFVHGMQEDGAIKITEALHMAIEVLEKQVPKKPTKKVVRTYFDAYDNECVDFEEYCPNCGSYEIYDDQLYCSVCGQAIDWEL